MPPSEFEAENRYSTTVDRIRLFLTQVHPGLARTIDLDSFEAAAGLLERAHGGERLEVVSAQKRARMLLQLEPAETPATLPEGEAGDADPAPELPGEPAEASGSGGAVEVVVSQIPPVSRPGRKRGFQPKTDFDVT
jgi:hypothetical protein